MKLAIAAALAAATLAAPVLAADSTTFAVDHFNQSIDRVNERVSGNVLGVSVSSMGNDAVGTAIGLNNASIDSVSERVNADTVSVFSSQPAYGADIFAEQRAAAAEDE